eukprot:scaffold20365_cov78-Skeletonema_dohrnii-CCMP3373.AAC.2
MEKVTKAFILDSITFIRVNEFCVQTEEKLLDSFSFDWNVALEIPPYIERPTPIVACLTCDVPGA